LVHFVLFGIVIVLKFYGSLSYYAASREFPKAMTCMEEIGDNPVVLPVVSIEGSNIKPYTNSWGYLVLKKDIVTPYIFAGSQQPRDIAGPSLPLQSSEDMKTPMMSPRRSGKESGRRTLTCL
jgi:hypothetical protein